MGIRQHLSNTLLTLLFSPVLFASGDVGLGKLKCNSCRFCHGDNGIAASLVYPNLNGQKEQYLIKSMQAYQKGERKGLFAEMMKQQLSKISDEDLADIAIYYSQM